MTIHFYRTKRKVNALNKVKDVYVATIEIGETMDIDEISEQWSNRQAVIWATNRICTAN